MQARLEEAEAQSMKGGKKALAKLDAKTSCVLSLRAVPRRITPGILSVILFLGCCELEVKLKRKPSTAEAVNQQKQKVQDVAENFSSRWTKIRSHKSACTISLKNYNRKSRPINAKLKTAEGLAAQNLAKYRQLQHALEDAEERADAAENALAKMRLKNRSGSYRTCRFMSSTAVNTRSSSRGRILDDGIEE
ncbi:hypothetical protein OSTOST_14786 [Ostertagia ostertagi]